MTIYNAAPWLRQAVDSLMSQTFRNWELIAVENGSTDASPAILASYQSDPRIRVHAVRENMGRTPALRHAFDCARGEYIAVLDADDVAEPVRFERQVDYLAAHPDVALVGSWMRRIDGENRDIGAWTSSTDPAQIRDQFGFANPIVHSSAMYRAGIAREVGGYPADYPYAQDCGLWLRLAERAAIGVIGEYLGSHRTLPGSMTGSKESQVMVSRDTLLLLERAARTIPLSKRARRRNREERAIAGVRYAIALMRVHQLPAGLRTLLRAIVSNPLAIVWNRVYRAVLFS